MQNKAANILLWCSAFFLIVAVITGILASQSNNLLSTLTACVFPLIGAVISFGLGCIIQLLSDILSMQLLKNDENE